MPRFHDTAVSQAPPEEVWKLLYDPGRFPDWWAGVAAVETDLRDGEPVGFTYWSEAERDVPVPQGFTSSARDRRIIVSCLVHGFRFDWRLAALDEGRSTRIDVDVDVPDAQSTQFDALRDGIASSIARLATLAAR